MEILPLITHVTFATVCAYIAKKRGKSPYLWFALGMLLGLIGVFILFFSPKFSQRQKKPRCEEGPTTIDVNPTVISSKDQDKFWYYLDPENKRFGPMSFDALKRAWHAGTLTLDTYVWNENLDNWKRLSEFVEEPTVSKSSSQKIMT